MTDEAAFLAAIRGRPDDRAARLVYADWLGDRGDPRGELVRVEEELRGLPASADRYWELKPRRDELRAACEVDWLETLGYDAVYRPVFTEWPADWRGRWRLVRELVGRWYDVPMPDVGGHEAAARLADERLGRPLPPGVREWLALGLDLVADMQTEEVMRDGFGANFLRVRDDFPGGLQLMVQAEGDLLWAVRLSDLDHPDPPVRVLFREDPLDDGLHDFETGGWREDEPIHTFDTTAGFALSYVLTYLGGGGRDEPVMVNDDLFRRMALSYPVHRNIEGIELFERVGGLAHVYPGSQTLTVR